MSDPNKSVLENPPVVLASSSHSRCELLERLGIRFRQEAPRINETALPGETPRELVLRLAREKTAAVSDAHPAAIIIGSDQVAVRGDDILGKPGDRDTAIQQLLDCSGQDVRFLTSVCVLDSRTGLSEQHVDVTTVRFRALTPPLVETYVDRDRPLDCAGGFRAEGLGIALFEEISSRDPTALIGLPLIWLSGVLPGLGVALI